MVSALKKTEIQTVKEMVDMFKDTVNQSKAELDVIDEKYRKLIEEEKKSLKSQLAEATKQLKVWEKLFSSFDTTMVEEALGYEVNSTADEIVEEPEPVVTDTIFPENNESEDTNEPTPVAESNVESAGVHAGGESAPDGEPAVTGKDLGEEEDDEWNQRIESGELKEVPANEGITKEEVIAEETTKEPEWDDPFASNEKKEAPVLVDGDEGWPVPEEWK